MPHNTEQSECPDPNEVMQRLRELQIPLPVLHEAIRRGHLAGDFCTKAHARTYQGLRIYHEVNGELRTALLIRGWALKDDENIPRIIRADGSVVLTAVSGNEITGLYRPGVQTRYPRGEAGIRLVRLNGQFALTEMLPPDDPERVGVVTPTFQTWFLLYNRVGDTLRSELSLAHGISDDGNLLVWAERLILPEFGLYDGDGASGAGPAPAPTPDVDVPVTRRAG